MIEPVGWRVSSSLATDFVLDAIDQAVYDRCTGTTGDLVHHSDRGTQYVSMRYTERLAEAGVEPSVGSRGDSYDNALAESVIGLFKTEVIRRNGPWRHLGAVEFATLEWVDDAARKDVNDKRHVHEAAPRRDIGDIPHPELIRPRRRELPADEIGRPLAVGDRRRGGRHPRAAARVALCSPIFRISRRTRQRAARSCSRPICRHTFRGP